MTQIPLVPLNALVQLQNAKMSIAAFRAARRAAMQPELRANQANKAVINPDLQPPEGVPLLQRRAKQEGVPILNRPIEQEGIPAIKQQTPQEGVPVQDVQAPQEGIPAIPQAGGAYSSNKSSEGVGEYQHILRKGTDIEKLKKEGFKSGIGPNAMLRWDGKPTNVIQQKYAPKEGDTILYIPKEWIKHTGNGPKIKDGFIPKDENFVTPTPKQSSSEGGGVFEYDITGKVNRFKESDAGTEDLGLKAIEKNRKIVQQKILEAVDFEKTDKIKFEAKMKEAIILAKKSNSVLNFFEKEYGSYRQPYDIDSMKRKVVGGMRENQLEYSESLPRLEDSSDTVRVFRGIKDKGAKDIVAGDFVSTDKKYAEEFGSNIIEMDIPKSDLRVVSGTKEMIYKPTPKSAK